MVNKLERVVSVFVLQIIVVPCVVRENTTIAVPVEAEVAGGVEAEAGRGAEAGLEVIQEATARDIRGVTAEAGADREAAAEVVHVDITGDMVNVEAAADVAQMEN